jgi:superfamily II DNA helicase RecQ
VSIIGTGSGKSILFILPASILTRVMIIVVPLIMLRENILHQYKEIGIIAIEWNSARLNKSAQIMLIILESAVTEVFNGFINQLQASRRLD